MQDGYQYEETFLLRLFVWLSRFILGYFNTCSIIVFLYSTLNTDAQLKWGVSIKSFLARCSLYYCWSYGLERKQELLLFLGRLNV